MAFRRKCEDELLTERLIILKADPQRGPLGPVPRLLVGCCSSAFIPFGPEDPDGASYLEAARIRRSELEKKKKRMVFSGKREKDRAPEKRSPLLDAAEEWWVGVR